MVLRMARPAAHPITGIYWFRKRVPDALRSLIGKREEKFSLKTRDPIEAKIAHARVSAEVEQRWQRLSAGAQSLSHKQAVAIAGESYRSMIAEHGDNPSKGFHLLMIDQIVLKPKSVTIGGLDAKSRPLFEKVLLARKARNVKLIDDWLTTRGWILTPESRQIVGDAVDKAILQAREQLYRMRDGDYNPDPDANRFPKLETRTVTKDQFSLLRVYEDCAKARKYKAGTTKKWRPIMEQVAAEIPDIRNVTQDWVSAWRDRLLDSGLKSSTVKESQLASLKAVCEFAVGEKWILVNPVVGVDLMVTDKTKMRGYYDAEALKILRASLVPMSARTGAKQQAARRWIPTFCAYTGARVGEMAQLRKQDLRKIDGVWLLRITPEAGTVKTDEERLVALHPEVLRQGFVEFVAKSSDPLFYGGDSPRGGTEQNATHKKVGERIAAWISDERLRNHKGRATVAADGRNAHPLVGPSLCCSSARPSPRLERPPFAGLAVPSLRV
jgi:integrase